MTTTRDRADLCPGVFRPWPADDGALIRLRPVGGRMSTQALLDLVAVAERYGDGRVHITSRANLQLRALPLDDGRVPDEVVAAVEATGLLPSRSHELVRNIMASPQTGIAGGRANLAPVAAQLDRLLCADPRLAELPGRFLFVLDDRGDLLDRALDLGVVAINGASGQLRIGSDAWGAVLPLARVPRALVHLAHRFLDARGDGPGAAWHVDELAVRLEPPCDRYACTPPVESPLPEGPVAGGLHLIADDGAVDRALAERAVTQSAAAANHVVVVTPWRGLLVPDRIVR
ncbi:MAG TPA: nitrite reductase [Nocardioides sp.]|uniref:nitrite reductase n=1 Tax=uncultured Nocardioides sp. TaxID=198441 RepID=UPI000EDA629C|nr:nitrite reductase [uncultured Nocardioides sp.]HCB04917.1 nitrite reductase [Nocardioides sp.]HRI97383.1 nitrite reductase [Nocardioides sp.]